ncbi:GAF domain-containing protein [Tychonema sp. BBK16]|uniref:GAF domain-containing protein n=1 Tax=Tychonema sp. BBK16 TaxID=2699888 RepID=UPI001F16860A|nr:GAF domain-containing protein [Tychonema sp. BBK16]MCF6371694.1 GAF domain-containing protein [Tychonema sp. BBK16]
MQNNLNSEATQLLLSAAQNPDDTVNLSHTQMEQQKALAGVIARIRQSLDLETIFKTTAIEVRSLLKADRVGVFRFYPELDWEGEFVSEDVDPQWTSAIAEKVYDYCFGEKFSLHYKEGKVQAVTDIHNANLSDCHVDILAKFQVRANLIVPLLKEKELWGLLCIHQCSNPRNWLESEIHFTKQIAEHLTVAIQQAEYLKQAQYLAEQQKALTAVIARIRESFDLETIFQITVFEVRKLLKNDRVAVFRLPSELKEKGQFIYEDVDQSWISIISEPVYEYQFIEKFSPLYFRGKAKGTSDIYLGELDENYLKILKKFQVRANIVAPLLKGNELWGLLCIHQCSAPRRWEAYEIEFVSQIAEQLGVAIKQTEYLEQIQVQSAQLAKATAQEEEAKRQKVLAITIDKIRQSLDIETIFNTATAEVRQLLQADRVAIYQFHPDWSGTFVAESIASGWTPLVNVQSPIADTNLQETQGGRYKDNQTFAVDDIYEIGHADCHIALLEQLEAKAYAIAPILQGEKLWGLLAAYQNSEPRHWQQHEIDLLAQISTQLGIGLQQAEYVKQQAEYVKQVQTQAAQLAKATDRQRALATTVEKIRQSLDIDIIFQTTTQEVRQLLEVERVAIYRFYPDWSGEFVADSIVTGWTPIITNQSDIANGLLQEIQGGKYPRNETFVPILQGEKLWGLLVAYQNSQPRYWQDDEINLLAQVSVQLGVALQQAELLTQTRQQAAELTETLQELKQSQTRLIQGEKMAGLGQLVAGVAHEINNPVNFIFGNLVHVKDYTEALLNLIGIYHKHYPDPVPEIQIEEEDIDLDFLMEDLPKTLTSMNMGVDRIKGIVSSLRTFSRIDEAQMKPVDIHEGIDSTLLILQHRLTEKSEYPSIKVIKEYGNLPLVECYPAQLNQVFMNILSNGIDALQEMCLHGVSVKTPTIRIRTSVILDRVAVCISDNGLGILEDTRSRIFDPFFTTKAIGKGTGLGLSISHHIVVEKHQGQLRCISDRDRGTEFWIEIPIGQEINQF